MTSLNPVLTVGRQIVQVLERHSHLRGRAAWARAVELLGRVNIPAPAERAHEYPHQLSGGMRQRVVIALAVACSPKLLIADEPTTALDVTVQAQILELLRELQAQQKMALIFISHNLEVVGEICDRVAVMYAGRIVEEARVEELFAKPRMRYTEALLSAMPRLDTPSHTTLFTIEGTPPDLAHGMQGCAFASRCSRALPRCHEERAQIRDFTATHRAACWNPANAGHGDGG